MTVASAIASDTDEGGRDRRARHRMCAVTRAVAPDSELIRFVAAPDGCVAPDLRARLPGRGVWIGAERDLVERAVRKNVFARGLKTAVTPSPRLADEVAERLKEAALGRLGLARKAGEAAIGFAKVEAALAAGAVTALFIAADAAENGRRKIEAAARRSGAGAGIPVFRLLTSAELGLALGRSDVIHAAVLQGPAGRSLVEAMRRLHRYAGVGGASVETVTGDPRDVTDE